MKTTDPHRSKIRLFILTLVGFAALSNLVATPSAEARERTRAGTYTNARGNAGGFQSVREHTQGNTSRSTTWQNRRGEGSAQSNRQWNSESGGFSRQRDVTTASGAQTSTQVQGQRNADGGYDATGSRTGANSHTTDMARTVTPNGEDGASVTTTYTRDDGKNVIMDKSVIRTDDGFSKTATGTGPNGQNYDHDVTLSRDGNTLTRAVTNTGPNGRSNSRSGTLSFESGNP